MNLMRNFAARKEQSFYLFILSIPHLRKEKNKFKLLQISMNCNKTLKDVVKEIKCSITTSDIEKF